MSRRKIELRIDELVLHGFAPGDRHRIGEAVERELSRLMSGDGESFAAVRKGSSKIEGGAITLAPGAGPESAGAQIARAVYSGIAPGKRR